MNFFHQNDPAAPKNYHVWHFVYLHGQAENHNYATFPDAATAPDLFVCDEPMPTVPGEYHAALYGREVIAVVAYRSAKRYAGDYLCGRVACVDDAKALAHARQPLDWR